MPRGAHPGERRGGRAKGVRNKRTVYTRDAMTLLIEAAAQSDALAHPVALLLSVMTADSSTTSEKMQAATSLLDRLIPKLRSMALTTDQPLQVVYQVTLGDPTPPTNGHHHGPPAAPARRYDDA